MQNKELKLSILITTINEWIFRVKNDLLPQLLDVDEIIISHQITNKSMKSQKIIFWDNTKYYSMFKSGLSKNRNNALRHATWDICYICDDDLTIMPNFAENIRKIFQDINIDVATFQAVDELNNKHFEVNEWRHNNLSILKVWSWGITFRRKVVTSKWIKFNENFWLWTKYPVWEENIFLSYCLKKWLSVIHTDKVIVLHPRESSSIRYSKNLIIWRIQLWKELFWVFGWIFAIFYFTLSHHKYYKNEFTVLNFFFLSCSWLKNI